MGAMLVAACGSKSAGPPDASPPDAAPPDAHVARVTVYMTFDGLDLAPPASGQEGDAAANTTTLVTQPTTLPKYLASDPNRLTRIAQIVSTTRLRLAPYDVDVVTDRPAAPGYIMVVVTADSTVIGAQAGISAIAEQACKPTPRAVGLLFQAASAGDSYTAEFKANLVVAMLGFANTIPPVNQANDCMCWAGTACGQTSTACTVGGAGTPVDTPHACPGDPTTIDEHALFLAALGAHP